MKRLISIILAALMLAAAILPLFAAEAFADEQEENVALGKTVMGPGSGLDAVTDGGTDTNFYWDGGEAPSYVIIDLGEFFDIHRVNVVTYYGDGRSYRYTVEAGVDGLAFEVVGEKKDSAQAAKKGTDFTCSVTARYLKVNMTYNSANASVHLVEVSAYGKVNPDFVAPPVSTVDPNDPDNIAYRKPTRSNSGKGITAAVNDGSDSTAWSAEDYPRYVDIDLMKNYDLSSVKITMPGDGAYSYVLYGSLDGVSFERLAASDGFDTKASKGSAYTFKESKTCRILRLNVTGTSAGQGKRASIAEIRAYGAESSLEVTPTREKIVFDSYETWLKDRCGVDVSKIKDQNGRYDIKATYTEADTVAELNGIVSRLLGEEYISWFTFHTAPNPDGSGRDYYKIEDENGKVKITGADGVCAAAGLNWYLKYYCKVHISQQTAQVRMPKSVVKVGEPVVHKTSLKVRYAYNYCTLSYTMAFFGYDDWRRELDWLYLSGVNLILDTTATEALWVRYLQQVGYSADDAKNYICGYAYKAWWLMGNLEGYGGTVSDMWVLDTLEMARVNQRSMTVMGAQPALQTFVGAMPASFGRIAKQHLLDLGYPNVGSSLVPQGTWAGPLERPNVLRTDYAGYSYLAQLFYQSQEYVYGQITDYYCGDVCHEGGMIPEGLNREQMSAKILSEMMDYDPAGVWILQRWWDNPIREVLDGFGEYRRTNVMVIDLASAQDASKYKNTDKYGSKEFGGTGWIFSTLDNFGGNPGMHGSVARMVNNIFEAKESAVYLRGMGMTPEGTQNNPYVFDLYWETVWLDEKPDINAWTKKYVERRYGKTSGSLTTAWNALLSGVYTDGNADDGGPLRFSILGNAMFGYDGGYYIPKVRISRFFPAIASMMKEFDALKDNECYIYDLVDMMTTYLSYYATTLLVDMRKMSAGSKTGQYELFKIYMEKFEDCILLIDEICAYNKDERVGTWIGRAAAFANDDRTGTYDDYSLDVMTYNAKALITAWHSGALIDYANRRYNGLVRDYYYVGWKKFLKSVDSNVSSGLAASGIALSGSEHFLDAWKFVMNGVDYESAAKDPAGGERARGLRAIYDHIAANLTASKQKQPLMKIVLGKSDVYEVTESVLYGADAETTFADLAKLLTVPEGTELKYKDAQGGELAETDLVSPGCLIELYSEGERVDALALGVKEPTEEDLHKAELIAETKDFIAYAEALDTEGFTAEELARLTTVVNKAKRAVRNDGKNTKVSDLEQLSDEMKEARTNVDAVYDRLHPAETGKKNEARPSAAVIVLIVFGAVAAATALTVAVVLIVVSVGKKRGKTAR